MEIKERLLTYGFILTLVSLIIYFIFIEKPNYVDKFNKKIHALELKNDSILKVNDILNLEIDSFYTKIDTLNTKIISKDEEINQLRLTTDEKVNNVDSFSDDELQLFFTERYNKDTIR